MKKSLRLLSMLLLFSLCLAFFPPQSGAHAAQVSSPAAATSAGDFRAFWVATVYRLDYPSSATTDPSKLKKEADEILDYAKDMGYTAVFFQARPAADSLYPSEYFPWSRFLTGKQGLAPTGGFDPLQYWIDGAHKRGLELHAWLNPYRVTKKDSSDPNHDFSSLASTHPARKHPEWVIKYSDGNLYFDPGLPEVRSLILDSIEELLTKYDVDGIHFDDYFYPGLGFDDDATVAKYGKNYETVGAFRRASVDTLIKGVHDLVERVKPDCRFGVSPFGVWANASKNKLGSNTSSDQSYFSHFADTRKWVKEGWLDYIAPQLYWDIGNKAADYKTLLNWWSDVTSGTGVDLYIGHAAYRAGASSGVWQGSSEILRQLDLNARTPEVKGSIFFRYQSLKTNPELATSISHFYQTGSTAPESSRKPITTDLTLARPSGDLTTSYTSYYFTGTSDPDKPLSVNGQTVVARSSTGLFGVFLPLAEGKNTFTFSQGDKTLTRVVTRGTSSSSSSASQKAGLTNPFPQDPEYRQPGEKITLKCTAPAGSEVTATINGKSYQLSTKTKAPADGSVRLASYTASYTIPSFSGNGRNVDLGAPVYKAVYKGKTYDAKAPAKVGVILSYSPFFAFVTKDVIDTRAGANSTGRLGFLYKNMRCAITGMTGSKVRISQNCWVDKADVTISTAASFNSPHIGTPVYQAGGKWDMIRFTSSAPTSASADFDGSKLTVNIAPALSADAMSLPQNALFSACSVQSGSGFEKYVFTLKSGAKLDGFYLQQTDAGFNLYLKRRPKAAGGEKPLSGITVLLDAGHGGTDTGAIGSLGTLMPEKDVNLALALKTRTALEALGASVQMTRISDTTLSLQQRQNLSFEGKPDLFLSIHCNSLDDNVDISKVEGLAVFYKQPFAKEFAKALFDNTKSILNRPDRGLASSNLYVARASWTPSAIYESGFLPNPFDMEWLADETSQKELAGALAQSIVRYFS